MFIKFLLVFIPMYAQYRLSSQRFRKLIFFPIFLMGIFVWHKRNCNSKNRFSGQFAKKKFRKYEYYANRCQRQINLFAFTR